MQISTSIPEPCALAALGAVASSSATFVLQLPVFPLYVVENDMFPHEFDFDALTQFLSFAYLIFCFGVLSVTSGPSKKLAWGLVLHPFV